MMPYPMRLLAALMCTCSIALGANAAPRGESESILAAENALRDGDCRAAAENYLAAALVSAEVSVATRATQLAVGCEQLATARAAAARWRHLAPYSGDAALAATLVALKRYDLVEARSALTAWRESGSSGTQDPVRFAEALEQETDATALHQVFGEVLVGEDPSADVLFAQAQLGVAAQDMRSAMDSAQRALAIEADMMPAQTLVLRALSTLGEDNAAIEGARVLVKEQGDSLKGEDAFILPDLQIAADRHEDARHELERMATVADTKSGAERRLVALDLDEGNFAAAEARLGPMMGERGSTAMALYFLGQLAERRGDDARAVQNYRLLADSSVALSARTSAARLLLKHGDRRNALALLAEYAAQNPEAAIEVGIATAQLLAQSGDVDGALQGIDMLLERYPDHPDLVYQRATILETGGRTKEALNTFEGALKSRPDDPQLTNALGFTLADHNMKLSRAETLVREALKVSPDNPAIQDSLGWVLYRRGKAREALPVLERAWRNSHDSEIAAHYGEVLWKSGEEGQARYIWQQALNRSPDHKGLRGTMARLTGEPVAATPASTH
jgi:tetratricopeptide (TPR) repeat protein